MKLVFNSVYLEAQGNIVGVFFLARPTSGYNRALALGETRFDQIPSESVAHRTTLKLTPILLALVEELSKSYVRNLPDAFSRGEKAVEEGSSLCLSSLSSFLPPLSAG